MSYSECDAISVFSILGEPRDPRTWSRSPTGIIEAIEKQGIEFTGWLEEQP